MTDANANNDNGNGRITLALVGQKVDQQTSMLQEFRDEIREYIRSNDARVSCIERDHAELEKEHTRTETKLENLEGQVKAWNIGNSVVAGVAALLAYLGINK